MIDYIGSKRISLRRSGPSTMEIQLLEAGRSLELDADEWSDLVGLIVAVKAAVEYAYKEET